MEALAPQVEMTVVASDGGNTSPRSKRTSPERYLVSSGGTYKRSAGHKRQVDDH